MSLSRLRPPRPAAARRASTQPVTATGTLHVVADVMGNDRVGVELEADSPVPYDLNWNAPLPKGGEALGKQVTLAVHLEFIRQEA